MHVEWVVLPSRYVWAGEITRDVFYQRHDGLILAHQCFGLLQAAFTLSLSTTSALCVKVFL